VAFFYFEIALECTAEAKICGRAGSFFPVSSPANARAAALLTSTQTHAKNVDPLSDGGGARGDQ